MKHRTEVKKAFLHGTTPRVTFRIVDPDGLGFQPDTLTLSIYDYDSSVDPAVESIINGKDDVDVLAYCDASGNVEYYLEADDTEETVPEVEAAIIPKRRLLFTWTWGSDPLKVGKHEIILTISPDRETSAV